MIRHSGTDGEFNRGFSRPLVIGEARLHPARLPVDGANPNFSA